MGMIPFATTGPGNESAVIENVTKGNADQGRAHQQSPRIRRQRGQQPGLAPQEHQGNQPERGVNADNAETLPPSRRPCHSAHASPNNHPPPSAMPTMSGNASTRSVVGPLELVDEHEHNAQHADGRPRPKGGLTAQQPFLGQEHESEEDREKKGEPEDETERGGGDVIGADPEASLPDHIDHRGHDRVEPDIPRPQKTDWVCRLECCSFAVCLAVSRKRGQAPFAGTARRARLVFAQKVPVPFSSTEWISSKNSRNGSQKRRRWSSVRR